jgi:hypothetical protein
MGLLFLELGVGLDGERAAIPALVTFLGLFDVRLDGLRLKTAAMLFSVNVFKNDRDVMGSIERSDGCCS